MAGIVRTVLGDILPEQLGITLMHEHLLCDISSCFELPSQVTKRKTALESVDITNLGILHRNPFALRDNLILDDVALAIEEISLFKWAGGKTVVDVTCTGMGRDVAGLRRIAVETGLNVIAGCGYYMASSHPTSLENKNVGDVCSELVDEIEKGIDDTSIRPGIIGEIGTSQDLTKAEEKVLRAAARAQIQTGLAISIHPYFRDGKWHALKILDILEEEGVKPNRVIFCHMDGSLDLEYHKSVADRGAYVEYDTFGKEYTRTDQGYEMPKDSQRVLSMAKLIEKGYTENILISNDVCFKINLHRYGGWGYDHVLTNVLPMFQKAGLVEDVLHQILQVNPKKVLTIES